MPALLHFICSPTKPMLTSFGYTFMHGATGFCIFTYFVVLFVQLDTDTSLTTTHDPDANYILSPIIAQTD